MLAFNLAPYGIREPTERLGSTKTRDPEFKIKDEHLLGHIPSKVDYSLTDIYSDLMNYAAKHLSVGGRLAFWIPISRYS
jgi:tRNA (guanine10-N2)-methyltransferase